MNHCPLTPNFDDYSTTHSTTTHPSTHPLPTYAPTHPLPTHLGHGAAVLLAKHLLHGLLL